MVERLKIEPHFSLADAAARFFPGRAITGRSLYTEIQKGRLRAIKVAGKYVVSASAIADMLKLCQCPDVDSRPGQLAQEM